MIRRKNNYKWTIFCNTLLFYFCCRFWAWAHWIFDNPSSHRDREFGAIWQKNCLAYFTISQFKCYVSCRVFNTSGRVLDTRWFLSHFEYSTSWNFKPSIEYSRIFFSYTSPSENFQFSNRYNLNFWWTFQSKIHKNVNFELSFIIFST